MSKVLVIECGVAATRASLLEGDQVRRFWFGPARGDESNDQVPLAGRAYIGRVKAVSNQLKAAFVDIGDKQDAFLPIAAQNEGLLFEGKLVRVTVKTPPRQGKGAALNLFPEKKIAQNSEDATTLSPGRVLIEDPLIEAVKNIGEDADIVHVDKGEAHNCLTAAFPERTIRFDNRIAALFDEFGASIALSQGFERIVRLSNGAELIFDETQALTAIDVDSSRLKASSGVRLREKMAIAAVDEIVRQISLRGIGGHIVIDFPALKSRSSKDALQIHLKSLLAKIDGARAAGFSRSGLFSFTTPHRGQSLIERFTESNRSDPVPGRRYTLQWSAMSLMSETEKRLRRGGQTKIQINVGNELFAYLNNHATWFKRLADRHGQRFEFSVMENLGARQSEIVEKR